MSSTRGIESIVDNALYLQRAESTDSLFERFERIGREFGVTKFAVTSYVHETERRPIGYTHRHLLTWTEAYETERLYIDCPMTAMIFNDPHPATIEQIVARTDPGSGAATVMSVARELGLAHGLIVPMRPRTGVPASAGIITDDAIDSEQMLTKVHHYARVLQARFDELARGVEAYIADLTPREIEVLRWFAAGKNAEDVGTILGISFSTVMFHYQNAAQRLGTLNRTHTVSEALRRGLLY